MKFLIAGLGNIGDEYRYSRHNIGFRVLDALAEASNTVFADKRYGAVGEMKLKGRALFLLKPSTYMNLSGNAIRYWLQKENIPIENLLVIVDDLSLSFGTIRLKGKGSNGGHNGLRHIEDILGTQVYPRIRFGIGSDFKTGGQVNYVLGDFSDEEENALPDRIKICCDAVQTFCLAGLQTAMNQFNNK